MRERATAALKRAWGKVQLSPVLVIALLCSAPADAHKDHNHSSGANESTPLPPEAIRAINAAYLRDIKPIFQRSCFDCHGSNPNYPWYSKLPIANSLIEGDVREAKVHLDLSNDFPFKGHGTPREDLIAIRDSVTDGSMPPFRYQALHWAARLTEQEKEAVQNWVRTSLERMK